MPTKLTVTQCGTWSGARIRRAKAARAKATTTSSRDGPTFEQDDGEGQADGAWDPTKLHGGKADEEEIEDGGDRDDSMGDGSLEPPPAVLPHGAGQGDEELQPEGGAICDSDTRCSSYSAQTSSAGSGIAALAARSRALATQAKKDRLAANEQLATVKSDVAGLQQVMTDLATKFEESAHASKALSDQVAGTDYFRRW